MKLSIIVILMGAVNVSNATNNIFLLTLLPYPNPVPNLHPSWPQGDNIRPALDLAQDQINYNSSLLTNYTLLLIHADGGCQAVTTTAISFTEKAFQHRLTGIVGPGCSFATTFLGNLTNRTDLSLVHVHGAGSPTLADRTAYQYMLGTLGSTGNFVERFQYLLNKAKWEKVAILYDDSRLYYLNTLRLLVESINATFLSPVSDTFIPLEEIQEQRLRVTFVLCPLELSRQIVCLAYHSGMIYDNYQWVIMDKVRMDLVEPMLFMYNRVMYNCSMEDMSAALERALLLTYKLTPSGDAPIVSNITYQDYMYYYEQYREAYSMEAPRFSSQRNSTYSWRATYFYDAVWAWALALDNLTRRANTFEIGSEYGNKNQADMIVEQLYQTCFNGMSGEISFSRNSGFVDRAVDIFQVVENDSIKLAVVKEDSTSTKMELMWIKDSFPINLRENSGLAIFFLIVVLIQAVIIVAFHVLTVFYHKRSPIKASSPKLLHISYIGAEVVAVGIILWTFDFAAQLDPTARPFFCQIFWAWCLPNGFVLAFVPVAMRTWRAYRIFKNYLNPSRTQPL